MKRHIFTFIFSLAFLAPAFAFAQPGIPHQFYGAINFLNGPAPEGLTVEVRVDGTTVGSATAAAGKYGYNPSLLFASRSEGEWSGETAEFYVGGTKATTSITPVTLSRGGYTKLDITVPLTIGTASTPVSGGGGGGGGGSSAPVLLTTTTSVGDINNDHVVNKYDFALLMANWGKTGSNASDLNNDNVVNKYDFALMMARWTI